MTAARSAYGHHGGVYPDGTDRTGRPRWRLRATVRGLRIDERFVGTKTEARARLRNLQTDAGAGRLPHRTGETVEAFFEAYIGHRVEMGKLRAGKPADTHRRYVRKWVVPNLPRRLEDVRTKDVQKIVSAMIAADRVQSTPQVRAVVSAGFRWALTTRRLASNPADGVDWPHVNRPEIVVPSPGQVSLLIGHADDHYRLAITLAAATGVRASELAALRWENLLLDVPGTGCPLRDRREQNHPTYPHLHVFEGLHRTGGTFVRRPPKSARGTRWVPLSPGTVDLLRAHRRDQLERRVSIGPAWSDDDAVIDDGRGRPVDPNLFGRAFLRSARRAGIEGQTFHGLRHYFVTQLARSKAIDPATVSKVAGHRDVGFTLSTYYHPGEAEAEGVGAIVDAALNIGTP